VPSKVYILSLVGSLRLQLQAAGLEQGRPDQGGEGGTELCSYSCPYRLTGWTLVQVVLGRRRAADSVVFTVLLIRLCLSNTGSGAGQGRAGGGVVQARRGRGA